MQLNRSFKLRGFTETISTSGYSLSLNSANCSQCQRRQKYAALLKSAHGIDFSEGIFDGAWTDV